MTDRIADIWGPRTPYRRGEAWPARIDSFFLEGFTETEVDRWVQSACLLCSNGCGLNFAVKDGRLVGLQGRPRRQWRAGRNRLGHRDGPRVSNALRP